MSRQERRQVTRAKAKIIQQVKAGTYIAPQGATPGAQPLVKAQIGFANSVAKAIKNKQG